jgi:trehalose 6-phosphate synthase/phosphatase
MTRQTKASHYNTKLIVDMFRQLRKANEIPPDGLFATTVGAASKMTSAKWHVLEPMDIVDTMAKLARVSE